ncbi:MAG: AIPR family protein [Pseudomonadota bacterium]
MPKVSALDWDIINSRVEEAQKANGFTDNSQAFLWLVLDQYFPGYSEERLESITDGGNDRGIDAIHIIEKENSAEIFIFQSKYRGSVKTTSKTINDAEALKVASFIEELFDKADALKDCPNLLLNERIKRIWALHQRGLICRYRLVFCSNDQGISDSAQQILETVCNKHEPVTFESYGPRDIIADFSSNERQNHEGKLEVIGKEIFERTDGDVRGIIASVDAISFVKLISAEDGKTAKRYLFDDNLRIFLGSSGGYNSEIISTATSADSHLFWYLNNGITITCKNCHYNKGHAHPIITLNDFQIVNGAQTSHSLLEAYRMNPEAMENVVLMVRVYATDRSDISERVAVATNSQARIRGRDLRANHQVLKKLEMALLQRGYYFERKRNMHVDKPSDKRMDALKLGQVILAYYLKEPDKAKTESDSIFDSRFLQIFHDNHNIDELCRLFELFKKIENLRENYHNSLRGQIESGGDYQYLVYGYWYILYAINLILWKRGGTIPMGKKADRLIDEAINLVSKACKQQKSVAHYQMFRSPRTKTKIIAEFMGKQGELFDLGILD